MILSGDRVLLTLQHAPRHDWQLPGGGIDMGESPLPALHREVMEETGWSIAEPRRMGAFRRFVWMPEYRIHAEKVCTIYLARPGRRRGPPSEPGHRAVWMPAARAVACLGNDGDAAFLADAISRNARSAPPTGRRASRHRPPWCSTPS